VENRTPRLTSVMGVARALLSTVGVNDAVEVLVLEFGWDLAFQSLALLQGDDAEAAFGRAWTHLLTAPFEAELRNVTWTA